MGNTDHKSLRIFLSFVLVFSLIGVAGVQALSQAFAEEIANVAENMETIEEEDAENTSSNPTEIEDAIDSSDSSEEDGIAPEDLISEQSDEATSKSLGDSKTRYVYKHVYDYVYGGVFANEYAIATNEDMDEGSWASWSGKTGALISATQGEVFEEGIEFNPAAIYEVLDKGLKYVPFKQNGKWGLLDFTAKSIVVDPSYEIASIYPGGKRNDCWGFISEGSANSDGVHPNAKAVIYQSGVEAFSYDLENYTGGGYFNYYSYDGDSKWRINWKSKSYTEYDENWEVLLSDSYEIIELRKGFQYPSTTPNGHKVLFRTNADGKVYIEVTDPNGRTSDPVVLNTDQTNISSFKTVSNIIEVRSSNGFDYQYFTLGGDLLQNMNGQSFYGLGNYVAYSRISFDEQIPVQQFLDTNNATSEDAISIPAVKAIFKDKNNSYFECMTLDNKIQRYDADLNKVLEFNASIDVAALYEQGNRNFTWGITDLCEQTWSITESVNYATKAMHIVQRGSGAERDLPHTFFGLNSPRSQCGIVRGKIFLMEDNDAFKLRLFNQDLSFYKEVDLSTVFPEGSSSRSIYLWGMRVSVSFNNETGNNKSRAYYLDPQFNLIDYEDCTSIYGGQEQSTLLKARKDGKWGFVDSNLAPLSDFIYDDIFIRDYDDGYSMLEGGKDYYQAQIGDDYYLFDENLNDVLGYSFSRIYNLGNNVYKINHSGGSYLYKGSSLANLTDISLFGYRLIDKDDKWQQTIRPLSNGDIMIYVQNSSGKIGAIDSTGKIVIPFEYSDYLENVKKVSDSGYILLKDDQGWFFVHASELQPADTNPECDKYGHDYEETIYEPTCTTNGYTQHVCKRCGSGYRDESTVVPMLGHDFRQVTISKEPTCTEAGSYDYSVCSRCGEEKGSKGERPPLGHNWDRNSVQYIQYPTCTEDGSARHACLRCGVEEEYVVSAYGHEWSYSPEWTWSSDFQAVTARTACTHGCGEYLPLEVALTHENVEGGIRHSAVTNIYGRDVKDGRLTLGWTDENGVARDLLIKGAPVADGFYAWPQGLKIAPNEGSSIVIDVTPVTSGGVFDSLVSKIGSGWPGGTFEVKMNIDDNEVHDGFGSLKFAFPAGGGSIGKKAVIHHCHKNDRGNITSHDVVVDENGMIVLGNITDLSTFALEILEEEAVSAGPSANNSKVSGLPSTGDATASLMVVIPLALECLAFAIAFFFILRRKRNC